MLLTIDIGNTNIVFGVFTQDKLLQQFRIISNNSKSSDEYAIDIIEQLITSKIDPAQISGCIIGSVVPDLAKKIEIAVSKFYDYEILNIGENVKLDIATNLKNEEEIGCDRLINTIAAFYQYSQSLIILDFGTATTFDIVSNKGAYLGGVISPGINLSLKTLHDMTAKLPKIEITKQDFVIGKNTVEAMNSGIYFGYLSLIEGMVARIKNEMQQDPKVIMTGGLADLFHDKLPNFDIVPNLTLEGLKLIYQNNIYKKI